MVNYVTPNGSPGWHLTGNPLYAVRHFLIFQMSIASAAIDGAFGALDEFASQLTAKKVSHGDGALRADDPDYQRYYGSAYTKLRMARAAVLAVAENTSSCAVVFRPARPSTARPTTTAFRRLPARQW